MINDNAPKANTSRYGYELTMEIYDVVLCKRQNM